MSKILNFWDMDGTLLNTPLPDVGKIAWSNHHGTPYKHIGWWGREESLDKNVFTITPKDIVYQDYLKFQNNPNVFNFILTSRLPKLKSDIQALLDMNGIVMDAIYCAKGALTKGERIIEVLNEIESRGEVVFEINVWEDRNKEVVTMEAVRKYIEDKGIILNITKVQSDAND
jgi:hypothetical protein